MPKVGRKKKSGWIDFAAVKRQVSIEQVLEHYDHLAELEEKDDGYCGPCPFHEGESPRPFHVSTSKNAWYCHGCEEGGNVLDFAEPREEPRSQEAAPAKNEALSGPQGADLEEPQGPGTPSDVGSAENAEGNKPLGFALKLDPGHELLRPLGFDRATIERFEAGYCSRGMMAGHLAVPIHSPTGELLAYAGWSLEGKGCKFPPKFDRQRELYNLHRAVGSDEHLASGLIVVADVLDVWRLSEAGYPNAIASMASSLSERQVSLLATSAGPSERVLLLLPSSPERDELAARLSARAFVRTLDVAGELPFQELQQLLAA
jgi:DNA primase